ncbi:hypothetical protein BC629DRAFT_295765 [Irpex lacteus]|nr:hypothetical protein BC629DRAFT_295765 [Irpex lacteus]
MVRAQPIYFYTRILPLFLALSPATHMARLTDLAFIQRDNPSSYGQTVLPWLSDTVAVHPTVHHMVHAHMCVLYRPSTCRSSDLL